MPGGKSPHVKGASGEREIAKMFGGKRTFFQPGKAETQGDVIDIPGLGKAEVKRRKGGFVTQYQWLADNDAVFFRADRKDWLVTMRAERLKGILEAAKMPFEE